jgi:hypothetical protein
LKRKNLGLLIFSLFILSACGSGSSHQEVTEGSVKEIKADTTSKDTLKIEKSKAPNLPKDNEGTEKMDEIINRAKNQKL